MTILVVAADRAEKLKMARKFHRPSLTQEELAKRLGISRSLVAAIERGDRELTDENVRLAADLLRIPLDWWYDDGDAPPPAFSPPEKKKVESAHAQEDEVRIIPFESLPKELQSLVRGDSLLLPLWRGVMGSPDGECEFVEADTVEWIEVPAFLAGRDYMNARVCKVAGMSMAPRIRQGDRVVVRLESNPSPGMIVVVERPNDRAKLIKVLRDVNGKLALESIGKEFPPIADIDGWQCVAVAIGIWTDREGGPNIEWDSGRPLRA